MSVNTWIVSSAATGGAGVTESRPGVVVDRFGTVKVEPSVDRAFRGGHKAAISSVCFVSGKSQIVSGGEDGGVLVWHQKPQLRPIKFPGHVGGVSAVGALGGRVVSAGADKTIRIWENSNRGGMQLVRQAHTAGVRSVCWSNEGKLLVSASDDKSVKIWDGSDARFKGSLLGHTNWVRQAVFSHDSLTIASGGDDRTVRVWDTESKKLVKCFYDCGGAVNTVAFHPQESAIVAGAGMDRAINIWDCRSSGQSATVLGTNCHHPVPPANCAPLLQSYKDAHGGMGVNSIAFHPSGFYLLSGGRDGLIRVWDLREGRLLWSLGGAHNGSVNTVAFDEAGGEFLTAGTDQTVLLWKSNLAGIGSMTVKPKPKIVTNPMSARVLNTAVSLDVSSRKSPELGISEKFQQPGFFSRSASPGLPPSPSAGQSWGSRAISPALGSVSAITGGAGATPSCSIPNPNESRQEVSAKLDLILGALHALEGRLRVVETNR